MHETIASERREWWRYAHVWLVISGPVGKDPVVDEDYYRKGIEINKTLADNPHSLAPAVQARNHAATGVPAPKSP